MLQHCLVGNFDCNCERIQGIWNSWLSESYLCPGLPSSTVLWGWTRQPLCPGTEAGGCLNSFMEKAHLSFLPTTGLGWDLCWLIPILYSCSSPEGEGSTNLPSSVLGLPRNEQLTDSRALTGQAKLLWILTLLLAGHSFLWEKTLALATSQDKSEFLCPYSVGPQRFSGSCGPRPELWCLPQLRNAHPRGHLCLTPSFTSIHRQNNFSKRHQVWQDRIYLKRINSSA